MEQGPRVTGAETAQRRDSPRSQPGSGGAGAQARALGPRSSVPGSARPASTAASECGGWSALEKADSYTRIPSFSSLFRKGITDPVFQMRKQFPPGQQGRLFLTVAHEDGEPDWGPANTQKPPAHPTDLLERSLESKATSHLEATQVIFFPLRKKK